MELGLSSRGTLRYPPAIALFTFSLANPDYTRNCIISQGNLIALNELEGIGIRFGWKNWNRLP